MKKPKITQGKILIASSDLNESTFSKTVIYLAEHNDRSTVGFILNRPLGFSLSHFFGDKAGGFEVWWGGPVDNGMLFFIHNVPEILPTSKHICGDIYWGGDFKMLRKAMAKGLVDKSKVRFFLGYCGWDKDQLENEIKERTWVVDKTKFSPITEYSRAMWIESFCDANGDGIAWDKAPKDITLN